MEHLAWYLTGVVNALLGAWLLRERERRRDMESQLIALRAVQQRYDARAERLELYADEARKDVDRLKSVTGVRN